MKVKFKKYYEENKDIISEKGKEKYECEFGSCVRKGIYKDITNL